ncbi:MAG: Sir2 silent information regulator family NAD-dependent deacetylase [Blautia sp.]|nr:Sir2 silent information regulator family NAD-dependent deacetylase [Blautia sp.]
MFKISDTENGIERLRETLDWAEAVIIGAGAGLSTSAGFAYAGERFETYFSDFAAKYPIQDIYSGGFYPFESMEEFWGWWSRHIWINRYMKAPRPVYERLLELVKDKDYFVITTNVDHQFQRTGFDRHRMFYTQGDYGLLQCSRPCHQETYDNEEVIRRMLEAQGFSVAEDGALIIPEGMALKMSVPTEMVPRCPKCGKLMTTNLRSDDTFVQDNGWDIHAGYYDDFLRRHKNMKTLFLDLGTGANTPVIVKIPFMRMTYEWPEAVYASLNYGEAFTSEEIRKKSICINDDIGKILDMLNVISENKL